MVENYDNFFLKDKLANLPGVFIYEIDQFVIAVVKTFCLYNDYHPVIINDERDFNKKVHKYRIDIFLVNLEIEGSIELINYLKSDDNLNKIPILAYSENKEDSIDATNLGVDAYISKFTIQYKLGPKVKKLLRKNK